MSWLDDFVDTVDDEPTVPRLQAPSSGSRAPEFSSSEVTSAPQTLSWVDNFFGPAIVKLGALFFAKRPVLELVAGTGVAVAVLDVPDDKACRVTITNSKAFTPPTGTGFVTVTAGVLDPAAKTNTGTGFFTITSGAPDTAATANIRCASGKFQTDVNVQWKNGSITGDLAWAPATSNKTITFQNATGTVVLLDTADNLTNKTLTSPIVAGTPVYQGAAYFKIFPVVGGVQTSSTAQTIVASLHDGRRELLPVRRDRDLRPANERHEGGHLQAGNRVPPDRRRRAHRRGWDRDRDRRGDDRGR